MSQLPNLLQGPEAVETAELHFKLRCKLKIFEAESKYEDGHCCLLAVSQYYGLIFVGNVNGFSVIQTKSLSSTVDLEAFPKKDIVLDSRPTHISVDNSQKILAVVCRSEQGSMLIFYNIQAFANKDVSTLKVTFVSKLIQNSTAQVVDLTWQPVPEGSLMFCLSDGSVLALSQGAKDGPIFTLPNTTQATCFCWSPKGKQIVVGNALGTLTQYKPDLKAVKTLPPPPLFNGAAMVVSVLWISSFQFAVAYNDRANPESFPVITVVNAAKNEPVNVINYDDITYSTTLFRNHQIYMTHQSAWNLIFVSSANSIEVAVLHSKDGSSWEQWLLGDASRAELPLNPDRQETFPLGWGFDFTSQESISWGEGTLPPMPRLLLVSDEGLLCVFNVVNTAENASQLCGPPKENFNDSLFVVSTKTAPPVSEEAKPALPAKSLLGTPPVFGSSKPTYIFQSSPGFGDFGMSQLQTAVSQSPLILPQQQTEPAVQTQHQKQPEPQPAPALVIQQHQTQVTINTQAQLQPQISFTQSPSIFKVSVSQFGTPATFSFGTTSGSLLGSKAVPPGNGTAITQPVSLTLKPVTTQVDIFAAKNLPQSTPVKQPEVTIEKTVSKKPEEVVEAAVKPQDTPVKGESPRPETPQEPAVDDSVYLSALQEEIDHFNSELQQLSAKINNLDVKVDSDEVKMEMKNSIDGLTDFGKELKETTEGQKGEFHGVVMDLMEAFAWMEDAKSRNLQRKNPSYIELKKSEDLDPFTARHMNDIRHLKYYIENQLEQLTNYLEKEWMDHQENYRNEVKSQVAVPPLEEVYKNMHYQLKILQKQKTIVQELKDRVAPMKQKHKPRSFLTSIKNPTPVKNNKNRVSELSKLAENLLQLKINQEENSPHSGAQEMMKILLKGILERSKKLTQEKQAVLRDALSECDTVRIRPVKTTLESSAFLRSIALAKAVAKASKVKPPTKAETPVVKVIETPQTKSEEKPVINIEIGYNKAEKKPTAEVTKNFQQEIPATVPQEKSPLVSLSGIVSNIGKTPETKPPVAFVFGSSIFQKNEPAKNVVTFGSVKLEQKQEEPKTTQPFTFGASKLGETLFAKKDPAVFTSKPLFGLATSTPVSTKVEVTKVPPPNVTVTPVTSAAATAVSSPFTFSAVTTTANLPKVNLFSGKEQNSTFGTPTTGNFFSVPSTTTVSAQTTSSSIFGTSVLTFGGGIKTTTATAPTLFGTPKTAEVSSTFTFTQPTMTNVTPVKATSETEEVDVLKVDEPVKKTETPPEKPKESPTIFVSTPSTVVEVTTASSSPLNVAVSTPVTSSPSTVFGKVVATTAATTETVTATTDSVTTSTTEATTVFSFSTAATPIAFGQTATTTTTAATTTASLFKTPTTKSVFGQVSSTTSTNIFGGTAPTTPTSNIFGGGTTTKPIFGQAATAVTAVPAATTATTAESIFGGSTSVQTSTPNTFGQKSDTVSQTTYLFGQLLSDSSRSVFGTSPTTSTATTTATTTNIFSNPKNLFGGGGGGGGTTTTTRTISLFGTTPSSGFSQTTSIFGQPTTTPSIFGQAQTSTPSSFFGQNICSTFGGGATVTSNQSTFESGFNKSIFGQSTFGQTTNNTSIFGGSSSIFGGTSSTTSSNAFQTPTTSTLAFGSTSAGPFSGGTSSFGENSLGSTSSTFQKPLGGFGSPPVFGGQPAFGGSPTFGGYPSFGSLPTFGSMSQSTFGQSAGSTTFENLANQNTVGFGNLAQQSQVQGFGSSSFEKKPAFGGNSFSSWRSK